jgi:hypothetical protein
MRQLEEHARVWRALWGVLVISVAMVCSSSAAAGLLNANLIVNGDAEADAGATQVGCNAEPCSSPGPHNDPPESWAIPEPDGNFTAVQYAVPGAPAPPAGGGANFFAGGYRPGPYTATQSIPVGALSTQIDGTSIEAQLSGALAGYSGESASPRVTAGFYSGASCSGTPLGSMSITLAASERTFVFFSRSSSARLPVGTRLVCVTMEPDGGITDYGDIYFDNLSLVLTEVSPLPAAPPPTTGPPPPTTAPPATTPPDVDVTINVNVAPNITTAITTGAPFPSPAIPATTDLAYNPQTGQFLIRIKYRIRESELKRLCRRGCPATLEIRSRSGRRVFGSALPGDGAVLGAKRGIRIKPTKRKLRIDVPITRSRLLDLDFTTVGGFRIGETRIRVVLRTPAGDALTVRDGRIRVSIARIRSGALPGLQGILAL